jgi:hypothetical protein
LVTTTSTAPAAWAGAVTVREVAEAAVMAAALPPKVTLAPEKPDPATTTEVPPAVLPVFGVSDVMAGAGGGAEHL